VVGLPGFEPGTS